LTADVGNLRWVGQPINVYYDYKYVGLWQIADTALGSHHVRLQRWAAFASRT
jgi:hypothetical protein